MMKAKEQFPSRRSLAAMSADADNDLPLAMVMARDQFSKQLPSSPTATNAEEQHKRRGGIVRQRAVARGLQTPGLEPPAGGHEKGDGENSKQLQSNFITRRRRASTDPPGLRFTFIPKQGLAAAQAEDLKSSTTKNLRNEVNTKT